MNHYCKFPPSVGKMLPFIFDREQHFTNFGEKNFNNDLNASHYFVQSFTNLRGHSPRRQVACRVTHPPGVTVVVQWVSIDASWWPALLVCQPETTAHWYCNSPHRLTGPEDSHCISTNTCKWIT